MLLQTCGEWKPWLETASVKSWGKTWLLLGLNMFEPLCKIYDFVSWDDNRNPIDGENRNCSKPPNVETYHVFFTLEAKKGGRLLDDSHVFMRENKGEKETSLVGGWATPLKHMSQLG